MHLVYLVALYRLRCTANFSNKFHHSTVHISSFFLLCDYKIILLYLQQKEEEERKGKQIIHVQFANS